MRRNAAKARPAAPRAWTGPREFPHQPTLALSHAVDGFHGRLASQRRPRGFLRARSAEGMWHRGEGSCLTGRPPAIVELVSRMCSSQDIATPQVGPRSRTKPFQAALRWGSRVIWRRNRIASLEYASFGTSWIPPAPRSSGFWCVGAPGAYHG
jgi:hypothetical protein